VKYPYPGWLPHADSSVARSQTVVLPEVEETTQRKAALLNPIDALRYE
jgi:hypothetical protein